VSGVGAVLVVAGVDTGVVVFGGDFEMSTAKGDGVAVLIASLDGELKVFEVGGSEIDTGQDVDMDGSVFDVLAFEGDIDGDWALELRGVVDSVGAIVVVGDFGGDLTFGTSDVDDEGITAVISWLTFVVDCMNDELGWLVVDDCSVGDTIAGGIGVVGIARPLDLGVERGILDVLAVEGDVDVVDTRFFDLVDDVVGAVFVVGDARLDVLGTRDLDLEGVAACGDVVAVGVDGVDGEGEGMTSLTMGETVSLSVGTASVTLFHEGGEWAALDGLTGQSDIDSVATREGWGVRALVGAVLCVVELNEDGFSCGIADGNGEWVVSGGDVVALGVAGLNNEGGRAVDASAFDTRA